MIDLLHPPIDQIREFGFGRLQTSAADEIASHIDECDTCCEHLRTLPDDDFMERIRRLATSEVFEQLESQAASDLGTDHHADEDLSQLLSDHPRYRVIRQIGSGGMGEVYLARHMVLDRTVALKVIRRAWRGDSSGAERFGREMQAVARLSHPNIVTAYDAEPLGETAVLAMEYLEGETLAEFIDRAGPRPLDEAAALIEQAAAALQHAHERGLVHRDVKPQNIIRAPDGSIKVLDFGLAQLEAQAEPVHEDSLQEPQGATNLTLPGMHLGTPEFRSPEQATGGPVDVRSDVYGLGAVLSYLLLGKTNSQVLRESFACGRTKEILAETELPSQAIRVLRKALAAEPNQRYRTALEFSTALRSSTASERSLPRRRYLIAMGLLGVFGAMLATVIATIVTDTGTVEISSDDPDVEIRISKGGEVITVLDQRDNRTAVLNTGTYDLKVVKDDTEVEVDLPNSFTLRRDGREIFSIRREITAVPEPAGEPALAEQGLRQVHAIAWPDAHVYVTDFSRDGRLMLGAGDRGMRVWDVDSGELVREFQGHEGYVNAAAFSPEGNVIVSGGWQDNTVILWDVETGEQLQQLTGHQAGITRVDASSDGAYVLSASADRTLRIWNRQTGKLQSTLVGHSRICGGRFSADGKQVLSFSHDGTARLWDVETSKTTHEFVGHQDRLAGCAFGQASGTIVTWSYDRSIRVWDIDSEKEIRKLDLWSDLQRYPHAVKVFPAHNLILSCHGDPWLRVTRFDDGVNLANQHSRLKLKGFSTSADGRLAAAGAFTGWLYVYELPLGENEAERTKE